MIGRFLLGMASGAAAVTLLRRRPERDTSNGGPADTPRRRLDPDRRRLVGIIAHELRTPTSVIMGYQELLSEGLLGPVNGRGQEALERIRRAAAQLRDLTDGLEILTGDGASRHDAGGEIVDFNAVVSSAIDACVGDAKARGLSLGCETNGHAHVNAGSDTLARLIDLLVTASIRSTTADSIVITVARGPGSVTASSRGAAFDAERDGPSLSAQPDSVATAIGLRLAIAQRLAASVGGTVSLENGQFRLRLPSAPDR